MHAAHMDELAMRFCLDILALHLRMQCDCLTSSPGEHVASTACHMDCFAPLLTTISSAAYMSPLSSARVDMAQTLERSACGVLV